MGGSPTYEYLNVLLKLSPNSRKNLGEIGPNLCDFILQFPNMHRPRCWCFFLFLVHQLLMSFRGNFYGFERIFKFEETSHGGNKYNIFDDKKTEQKKLDWCFFPVYFTCCCSDIYEYHIIVICLGYHLMLNLCTSDTENGKGEMLNRGNCRSLNHAKM